MNAPSASATLAFLIAATAGADPSADGGHFRADVMYALSGRDAQTRQGDFVSSYGGFAPSFLRLDAAWFAGPRPPGWTAELRIERFRLSGTGLAGAQISDVVVPFQAAVGATGEAQVLPWLRLQGVLGYGLAAVPATVFSSADAGAMRTELLSYHGPVLGLTATALVKAPHFIELTASALPIPLGGALSGAEARGAHLSFGARGAFAGFQVGNLRFAGMLEYELHGVSGRTVDEATAISQTSHRVGLGLRVSSRAEGGAFVRPREGPGRINGRVLAAGTREPIAGAEVSLGGAAPVRSDRSGAFVLPGAGPGPVTFEVHVAGFRVASETVQVPPGGDAHSSLYLIRKTGPGAIRGKVFTRAEGGVGEPIAGAEVRAQNGAVVTSAEDGSFAFDGVGPGPVALVLNARNHDAAEEIVNVPPEGEAEVQLALARSAARSRAAIRGQVRSAKGGEPVRALLVIREAKVTMRADREGRFNVRVPGGRYQLQFSARGYVTQTKTVDLGDGDQALFYIDLSPGAP